MTPETLGAAAATLRRALDLPVSLAAPCLVRQGGRSAVWRCRVRGGAQDAGAPPAVIVKTLAPGSPLGLTDLATLGFLGERAATAVLVPRLLGADLEAGVVVLEDLGDTGTLDTRLLADGPRAAANAQRACVALAAQYARLHAAGRGREEAFRDACERVPGALPEGRVVEVTRWLEGLQRVRAWLAAAGCPEPPGLREACAQVAATYATPGAYLTLTHGDPAPTNAHVGRSPEAVRLLDFEYAAYRHALYDLTAWDVLCPLPPPVVRAMRRRYRARLAPAVPVARDATAFRLAWGTMVTFRALAILSWISVQTVDRDASWVGAWTRREAVLAALSRLEGATSGIEPLAPAAARASALGGRLRALWPEWGADDTAPRWPALPATTPPAAGADGEGGSGGDEAPPPAVDAQGVRGQIGDPGADGQDA